MKLWQILLIYIIGVVVILYCLTILPGKRKNKKTREMHDSVAVGDQVSTIGGIIGTVVARSEDIVTLRIDDDANVTMRVIIFAIHSVVEKAPQ